tara:strand:+ start:27 stop:230 length:204 start_codon:yes stop_codon:yes gene_type:complete
MRENIVGEKSINNSENLNQIRNHRTKVNINTLLNKVRADQKKERFESLIFVGLISSVILITGIIVSL